jgi:DNA-binding sugar fermentation-stimulating protein
MTMQRIKRFKRMFKDLEIIEGIFIKASKHRFLCNVLINGQIEECYVANSSKVEKYINLFNKPVLLSRNLGTSGRTRYSLFAVKYYGKYILLNLNKVNDLLNYYISETEMKETDLYTIRQEEVLNGYKADLVIRETTLNKEKMIEAKAIIDVRNSTHFPKTHSDRAIKQLLHIKSLLDEGHNFEYYLVSLSPIVRKVSIDSSFEEYYQLFNECIKKGLKVKGISVDFGRDKEVSFKKIGIEYS